jgi:hypothetical protein
MQTTRKKKKAWDKIAAFPSTAEKVQITGDKTRGNITH